MKVNILMATYNGQAFVGEQIESIQNQTFQDWQLLIRDDASCDKTREIIRDYAQKDSRIRLIDFDKRENLGVIKSFYILLKHEPADFYFFSDQDDIWLPDKLAHCLKATEKETLTQPLLVYTDLKIVDKQLKVLHDSMIKTQSHHANTTLSQELTENTVTGGTMMINHALAQQWQETAGLLMHDWYLALVAASMGKLIYLDIATELYRQHDTNVLGARTWSKRIYKWLRPQLLFSVYWDLIKRSQEQARHLLALPLTQEKKELVDAFVTIMDKPMLERYRTLKKYGLRKNKGFHTLVFTSLIVTKFAYKE